MQKGTIVFLQLLSSISHKNEVLFVECLSQWNKQHTEPLAWYQCDENPEMFRRMVMYKCIKNNFKTGYELLMKDLQEKGFAMDQWSTYPFNIGHHLVFYNQLKPGQEWMNEALCGLGALGLDLDYEQTSESLGLFTPRRYSVAFALMERRNIEGLETVLEFYSLENLRMRKPQWLKNLGYLSSINRNDYQKIVEAIEATETRLECNALCVDLSSEVRNNLHIEKKRF